MKIRSCFLLLCVVSSLWLVSGCNDEPDAIGSGTQPSKDFGITAVDTLYTELILPSHPEILATESLDRIMIGKYQSGLGYSYETWACLVFYSWPDSLAGATIHSATVQLKPFYHFGDSLSSMTSTVYRAAASLFGDSLTYDSVTLNSSYYYNPSPINSGLWTVELSDTLTSFTLDPAVVTDWFASTGDTLVKNYGMVIAPANANVIRGFYSCAAADTALQPTLFINYTTVNGYSGTHVHKTGISKYISHVNSEPFQNSSDGKIRIQNGISYRSLLNLSSLSFNTLASRWPFSVHSAKLELTLDSASSSCIHTPFLINYLYGLSVGSNNAADGAFYALSTQYTNGAGQQVYQFDLSRMMSAWMNSSYQRKIAISGFFESGSFDLYTFFGPGAAANLKPRLIITYSK